jgi:uncharacterized protein with NAD-binding domain and iron-sulfur cluster
VKPCSGKLPAMSGQKRVVVLGGGIAGISAAWELSKPQNRAQVGSVTVYQRGWRLGGKGASGRGVHGRIEEHGLHVWLGYYDNAFRMMRECYAELDRPRTDPGCPLLRWDDAFRPARRIGLGEQHDEAWLPWVADFSAGAGLPGEPGAGRSPLTVPEFARRSLILLRDLAASLSVERRRLPTGAGVVVTTSPMPPRSAGIGQLIRDGELASLIAAIELISLAQQEFRSLDGGIDNPVVRFVTTSLWTVVDRLRQRIEGLVAQDTAARRVWHFLDLMRATLRGIVADNLLLRREGFAAIDDQDYRAWIAGHGAAPATLRSPLVRGVYDLAFGYRDGDDDQPGFAAGTGVLLSAKLFFDYRGAIFWKMMAGMGDVVFAPLYQVLTSRGVRFQYFHRLDALRISAQGDEIAAIDFGVQAELRHGVDRYEPLVTIGGLPCWPSAPRHEVLEGTGDTVAHDYETIWSTVTEPGRLTLRAGEDFDAVVLAVPVGMHRYVCRELIENPRTPEWRRMTEGIATAATQALQVWLKVDEAALGWPHGDVTVSGYADAFHTHASMSHLLAVEGWPADDRPVALVYFCHTLPTTAAPPDDPAYPDAELARVREHAVRFLREDVGRRWPASTSGDGFLWEVLHDTSGAAGEARLDAQYLRANVDPSDRYVLSLPGSGRYRLRADESGYGNLFLAGDWTDSGLNAGCIEAAVMSGIQAANAVLGRPLLTGVTGFYLPHHSRAGRPWEPATPLARS